MAYIKYLNSEEFIEAQVMPADNHVIRVTADTEPETCGFRLYLRNDDKYPLDNGEYEAYTTLYRQGDGWFELSDDGSVWQEPEEAAQVEPTEEELAELERQRKISDLMAQIEQRKRMIESTDYQIIKTYEYSLVGLESEYDINVLHAERQELRDSINELETQAAVLMNE